MIAALLTRLFGSRVAGLVTPWLVLLALVVATLLLGGIFHEQAKLQTWLVWRYAGVWIGCAVFAAACLSAGNWIVTRLSESQERGVEHVTLSLAAGVFAFFTLTTAVGLAGGLGKLSFVVIPSLLFGLGARQLWTDVTTLKRRVQEEPALLTFRPAEVAGFALGLLGLVVIFLAVLVPNNVSYDARWYHMATAEHYAAAGGIVRSVEGNITRTIPQLATVLFTWAFCIPWGGLFERVELAAHLEFVIFCFTLPGVVALVRHLVAGVRVRAAWLAVFAFPSVFVYDSSLHGGADHVAALWTVPAYLTLLRAFKELRLRACLLFAISISGLLMSKYTAVSAAAGPVAVLTLRGIWLSVVQLRSKPRRAPAAVALLFTLAAGLVLTSAHWLKNLIWHGDPLYPMLHRVLRGRPWNSDGDYLFAVYKEQQFVPSGTLLHKIEGMFKALYDHSYALYNWSDFHGTYPVFGSLFTFSLFALPFLKGAGRTWALVAMTHAGIIGWYWVSNAERYLQVLLPWMASVVVALAVLAWRSGWPARAGVVLLGGLQLVWGADMPFWPLHRMNGKSPVGLANEFFALGYGKNGSSRTKPFEEFAALGRELGAGSKVLVHHEHLHLGLGTMVVSDATRMVYGINYGELGSPAAVHQLLRDFGVTHLVWQPGVVYGDESVAGDLVFHTYAQSLQKLKTYAGRTLGQLPVQAPRARAQTVLVHQCDGSYAAGLYQLSDLRLSTYSLSGHVTRFPQPRAPSSSLKDAATRPEYAVINEKCAGAPSAKDYVQVAAVGTIRYFALK